jgi:XTP/dITP diphosphohydrolase
MIYYVTTNESKIQVAEKYLAILNIAVVGKPLDLEEIQSHSGEEIIKRKAHQAFEMFKHPLFVTDHIWHFPALKGFPGAYMKYMNEWLSPQDFLNLMKPYKDRTAILDEFLYYIDGEREQLFHEALTGTILPESKGKNEAASRAVISLRADGKSIAECWEESIDPTDAYPIWKQFADWYTNK